MEWDTAEYKELKKYFKEIKNRKTHKITITTTDSIENKHEYSNSTRRQKQCERDDPILFQKSKTVKLK